MLSNRLALLSELTLKSMWNRRFTASLAIFSIAISVLLILSVETIRTEARESFTNSVSGTDLLVGARSGPLPLLLYSVFHIGNATNNIDWKSYQEISGHRSVAWSVPLSLGDSHRGFRVIGTTQDYFTHFTYGDEQSLRFAAGQPFADVYDAVIGADVAEELGYAPGDALTLAHGVSDTHFSRHDDKPFTLVGVLQKTGTPVDRSILVSLEGIEALHIDWQGGTRSRDTVSADEALKMDLQPKQITAFMLGLQSKMDIFRMQRAINNYRKEPLLAILPGIALSELWQLIGTAEKALFAVSVFVLVNSFIGLLTLILSSLNERRREIAILRSLGARPRQVFSLLTLESLLFAFLGCVVGMLLYYLMIVLAAPLFQSLGLYIPVSLLSAYEWSILGVILLFSVLLGIVPGYRAYRLSLAEGMSVKA